MVDQNTFINTYIDIIINSLQEYLKANLQLQTQAKVSELTIAEKDKIISDLSQQINDNKTAEDWKIKYEAAETNYSAILGKLKHMDGLMSQLNNMKNIIAAKDIQISILTEELETLKSQKKVINNKTKKAALSETNLEKTLDDF
jgi:cell division septum initiation protein DivIVA